VTDAGTVIRIPVHDIRIARRGSAGVVVFRVDEEERVVSVARLPEVAEENGDGSNGGEPNGHDPHGPGAGEPGMPPGEAVSEEAPEGDA
jgi:DNA gyrase subunit A